MYWRRPSSVAPSVTSPASVVRPGDAPMTAEGAGKGIVAAAPARSVDGVLEPYGDQAEVFRSHEQQRVTALIASSNALAAGGQSAS